MKLSVERRHADGGVRGRIAECPLVRWCGHPTYRTSQRTSDSRIDSSVGLWLQVLIGVYEERLAKTGSSYRPPNCGKQGLLVQEGTQLILLSWACFFLPLPLASTFLWPPRSVHQEHFCLFHQMSGCRDMIETSVVITGPITDRGSHERLPSLRTLAVTAITARLYLKCPLKDSNLRPAD